MTRYLNPVPRKRHHHVLSHILADDGISALCVCVRKLGEKVWPRVYPDDWEIGDKSTNIVCSRCQAKRLKMEAPPVQSKPARKSAAQKQREADKAKWDAWHKAAHEMTDGKR